MISMRIIDNTNPNIETETKIPTPLEMKENLAKQALKTPVLGEHFEGASEDYIVPASAEVRQWEEAKALDSHDEGAESPLNGNLIPADSEMSEDVDELPEDLKAELGEPDDESQNQ